jgi:preprotein translocase subunit YajC
MLSQLKNGDRVTTNGGIRGTIVSVKDDVVQLRVPPDNIKLEFVKSAIAAVTTPDE